MITWNVRGRMLDFTVPTRRFLGKLRKQTENTTLNSHVLTENQTLYLQNTATLGKKNFTIFLNGLTQNAPEVRNL
jgi:hypothetical protein